MTKPIVFSIILTLLFTQLCIAGTIHVPDDQPTIQAGIDAAANGDTVLLAPGAYYENLVVGDILLTIGSSSGRDSTFIEPFHEDSSILTAESSNHILILEGLTFQNGSAHAGGAIRSFERPLSLRYCSVSGCEAVDGAGIMMDEGDFTASQCLFADNSGHTSSAIGLGTSDATIDTCQFLRNINDFGVGGGGGTIIIHFYGSVNLVGCLFEDNEGCHNTIISYLASISLHNCIIRNGRSNGCQWGDWGTLPGSICASYFTEFPLVISNCLIEGIDGHAIGIPLSLVYIDNSTIVGNTNAILFEYYCGHFVSIENSIISNNGRVYNYIGWICDDPMHISCTDIFGNAGGDWVGHLAPIADSFGNFSADPRFCDPEIGDYHIDAFSPCASDYSHCGEPVGALGIGCESPADCGDVDFSGSVDIDDIVYLITFIFSGGLPPMPMESGDVDCSGGVDIDDVVYLINFVFGGGPEPCADCP